MKKIVFLVFHNNSSKNKNQGSECFTRKQKSLKANPGYLLGTFQETPANPRKQRVNEKHPISVQFSLNLFLNQIITSDIAN